MTTISLRLPPDELTVLDRHAGKLGLDRTAFIRMAVQAACDEPRRRGGRWRATELIGKFSLETPSHNAAARTALAHHATKDR
jgi:hypothetical protein